MASGHKFARATGRGQFRPPQNRGIVPLRHGPLSNKRTQLGQGKDAVGSANASNGGTINSSQEESFQLLAHPITAERPFAMIIRLQPEILEKLKQAELDGVEPMMKFGATSSGHVIQIDQETFKFSSAPEPGDLCDIYEQKKGEVGEAILVEAGSAWRKLSVQRILSATEKDRVKKRTAEAEKKQRQRKSILVDPSTQMIIPQAGAGEAIGRKPVPKYSKEPPPKKRKVPMSPVTTPLAPKPKVPLNATPVMGNHQFASPASPSIEPPASIRGTNTNHSSDMLASKGRIMAERTVGSLASKGLPMQKDKSPMLVTAAPSESGKTGSALHTTELRNFLIGVLQENSKGVTIKTVEKAMAEGLSMVPDKKTLEKVMRSVASFQAPGKYLLKPGVEKGSFVNVVVPANLARAPESGRPINHEDEPENIVVQKDSVKEKELLSDKGPPKVPELSIKEASPEVVPSPAFNSQADNNALLQNEDAELATKDPSSGGSDSSSSSESGSASESDTDSSGSGSGSDTGSGSGTGSDRSSSSSGASVEEDVDIMSDDDTEKKTDARQKPKARESKLAAKEDSRIQQSTLVEEAQEAHGVLAQPAYLACNHEVGSTFQEPQNIMESVFGPDEIGDFPQNGDEGTPTKEVMPMSSNSARPLNNKDLREKPSLGDADVNISGNRDSEALRVDEELDLLVEKVSNSKDMENSDLMGSRMVLSAAPQEHKKAPSKPSGLGSTNKQKGEEPDGKSSVKSLSVRKLHPEGSPTKAGGNLQKAKRATPEKLPRKQQTSVEAKRPVVSRPSSRESHEKYERGRISEIRGRSNSPRAFFGSPSASEGAMKAHDQRGMAFDRFSDHGIAEPSSLAVDNLKKERGYDDRISEAKMAELTGQQSRDGEAYPLQPKDSFTPGRTSKGISHRFSKDAGHLGTGHDRCSSPIDRSNKAFKPSKQTGETLEKAGLNAKQAGWPSKDVTRRGKDVIGKGMVKEVDPIGRPAMGGYLPREAAQPDVALGDSGHARSQMRDGARIGSQVCEQGEVRDPPIENGFFESKKWHSHAEESKRKATSGATSRMLPRRDSLSPDPHDLPRLDKRTLDTANQSPVKAIDDARHYGSEARSAKRRTEEPESAENERPLKRVGAAQYKQLHQNKEEWLPAAVPKENHRDKGRFSASDSQEYGGISKYEVYDNSGRSDEELAESNGLASTKQKVSHQACAASSGMGRDAPKLEDHLDTTKKQTPQSMEVQARDFFTPYEKSKASLRGLINTYQEYKEYYKEYHEKYTVYRQLHSALEQEKTLFKNFRDDLERARSKDDEKKLARKIKREFTIRHKKRKRMCRTFRVLHEELTVIKRRCKEYAEKVGQV